MFDVATSSAVTIETGVLTLPNPFSPEDISTAVAREKGWRIFVDSLVVCQFLSRTLDSPRVDHLVEMMNAATGWNFTPEEADKAGVRTVNLLRAFNIRHGVTPEAEVPSPCYGSAPVNGPAQGMSIAPYWEQMLENYYKLMGWNRKSGRPLPETLRNVGLESLISDLRR